MIPASCSRIYLTCPNPDKREDGYLGLIIPLDKIRVMEVWNYWGPVPLTSNRIYARIVSQQNSMAEKALYAHFDTKDLMMKWAAKVIHRTKNSHLY